jgi:phage shock protein A
MLASRTNLSACLTLLFRSLQLALSLPSIEVEVETPPPFTEGGTKMSGTQVTPHPLVRDTGETIFALRREAAEAVARQRRLRERLCPARAQAATVEDEARRALASGEDLLARQVIARGLCALETRRQLEEELDEARRDVVRLLATLVRTENRAWGLR